MRNVLFGIFGLMLLCMAPANAAAHARAGGFDAPASETRGARFGASADRGICAGGDDCSLQAGRVRSRVALDLGHFDAPPEIVAAIDAASRMTNVEFEYLLRSAALESSFDPALEATTSTAVGLYQFVEQSWLYMTREVGAELGLEDLAGAIVAAKEGYEVADAEARAEILRLRYDPRLSAVLAGLFTRRNFEALAQKLGREPDAGELYLAHVLGASGAATLIELNRESPQARANRHFARAARANRAIFFHKNRKPRSAAEVYEYLTGKYRRIPVYASEEALTPPAPPLLWDAPIPRLRIGGDEVHYAMR